MALGDKIASLRKQRGWTQDILAEKVGVHHNHVSRWENSRMRPATKTLRKLAALFSVSLDELINDEQPPTELLGKDVELVEKFRMVQEFGAEDRAVLFHLIDLMATQKQMEQLLAGHRK